jgi:hypothetical protein
MSDSNVAQALALLADVNDAVSWQSACSKIANHLMKLAGEVDDLKTKVAELQE